MNENTVITCLISSRRCSSGTPAAVGLILMEGGESLCSIVFKILPYFLYHFVDKKLNSFLPLQNTQLSCVNLIIRKAYD